MSRYKFYFDEKNSTIICVSSFAGKTVKGRAKCHPNDDFNEDLGKELAKLRCDLKVADKRRAHAAKKALAAHHAANYAKAHSDKMWGYYRNADEEYHDAHYALRQFETENFSEKV